MRADGLRPPTGSLASVGSPDEVCVKCALQKHLHVCYCEHWCVEFFIMPSKIIIRPTQTYYCSEVFLFFPLTDYLALMCLEKHRIVMLLSCRSVT